MVLGLHFLQPSRSPRHHLISELVTSPDKLNWTEIIASQSYGPLSRKGILSRVSFDIYGVLREDLKVIDPNIENTIENQLKFNGVGDTFSHAILPHQTPEVLNILVGAGIKSFEKTAGIKPRFIWPPETALNMATLEVLSKYGYEGVICGPEQLISQDGSRTDNHPHKVMLSRGKSIVLFPFDGEISRRIGFESKANADQFAYRHILPNLNGSLLNVWTDGETFGHHSPYGDMFLEQLIMRTLPSMGINIVSINDLKFENNLPLAILRENTAWSCSHGLDRWNTICGCGDGHDTRWKQPFYESFAHLSKTINKIVRDRIGAKYICTMINQYEAAFTNSGGSKSNPDLSLLSAANSAINSRGSCGTFFSTPGTSGYINFMFAGQSILHLRDAGLSADANRVLSNLLADLSHMPDPAIPGNTGADMFKKVFTNYPFVYNPN